MPDAVGVPPIVTTEAFQFPVTPAGNPLNVAPVAPVVEYVMLVMAVLIHFVWLSVPAAEVSVMVLSGLTVIVPLLVMVPHPPVSVIVKGKLLIRLVFRL